MVGVRGFEPPASASRTQRSSQTEPHTRAQPEVSRHKAAAPISSERLARAIPRGRGKNHRFLSSKKHKSKEKATADKSRDL